MAKATLTLEINRGVGQFFVDGSEKLSDKIISRINKLIKKSSKKLKISKSKALLSIAGNFAITGNGYFMDEYLDDFNTESYGIEGIEIKIDFSNIEQLENLISEIF